jgi:hypothetical protein
VSRGVIASRAGGLNFPNRRAFLETQPEGIEKRITDMVIRPSREGDGLSAFVAGRPVGLVPV